MGWGLRRNTKVTAGKVEGEAEKDQNWRRIMKNISRLFEFLTGVVVKIPKVNYVHAYAWCDTAWQPLDPVSIVTVSVYPRLRELRYLTNCHT
jgi:hypothetical protein